VAKKILMQRDYDAVVVPGARIELERMTASV
jgi:hypothetical protein